MYNSIGATKINEQNVEIQEVEWGKLKNVVSKIEKYRR